MKPSQVTVVLFVIEALYFTQSFNLRDYNYDCGESTNTALYECLELIESASAELDPDHFTPEEVANFCKAVYQTDECVYSALEECSNDIYNDDPDYLFFKEALDKAKESCSITGNTIPTRKRRNPFKI